MYLVSRERNPRYFTMNMKAEWDLKKTKIEENETMSWWEYVCLLQWKRCVLKVTITYLLHGAESFLRT